MDRVVQADIAADRAWEVEHEKVMNEPPQGAFVWAKLHEDTFAPISVGQDTVPILPPGVYDTSTTPNGVFFRRISPRSEEILRFPDSPTDEVVLDIQRFWDRYERFADHGFPHKRGIILWGAPGSGKSTTLRLIAKDVIDRGGIVLKWGHGFAGAYEMLRMIEPDRPLVVLMEDLDSIVQSYGESPILDLLDGIRVLNRVVFVATTNYPQKLGDRFMNRPSRFDRKVEVKHPGPAGRRMYLETLVRPGYDLDLDRWAADTDGFSLAHLKELFVAVVLLGNLYDDELRRLQGMATRATSEDAGYV
jgi:hypothetical protein